MLSLLLTLSLLATPAESGSTRAAEPAATFDATVSMLLDPAVTDFADLAQSPRGSELLRDVRLLRSNRLGVYDLRVVGVPAAQDLAEQLRTLPGVKAAWVPGRGEWLDVPNDPLYAQQWHLQNSGSPSGTAGADVNAEDAWDFSVGHPDVIIAILDSGVEITHPDLAPNIWHNAAETLNGIDDDANGFIDDLNGWDFFNDDADVTGSFFHGTRVAGMVAARPNDGFGVAGLAAGWGGTPGCRVLAIGIGDTFPDAAVIDDAILYAVDHGARVINLSISINPDVAIDLALAAAAANDVLVVAAAGNNGNFVTYPATHPAVMAVAATTRHDTVASFSGPGPAVEIAAPGDNVLTTNGSSGSASGVGTSFASPLVCAAAGLLFSEMPSLTAVDARAILIATAIDIESPGPDLKSGAGRLDAAAALAWLATSDCDGNGIYDPAEIAAGTLLDFDLNGVPDVCELGTAFCFGDGSAATSCPCGNLGDLGSGCANSTGDGAQLSATGTAVIAAGDFTLEATGARPGQTGVFLQGLTLTELPFKDGVLCAGNPTDRLEYALISVEGHASSKLDLPSVGSVLPGHTVVYQLWYRDPALSPCGSGSNLSNAFAVEWL